MEELDYSSMSLDDLKERLAILQQQSSDFYNTEQGIKLTLNSIYGATGNQYFAMFNPDVAESVTLQGQDIWKFAEKIVNRYFNDMWHLDTELHEKMEVKNVRKLNLDFIIYGDTDSNYINLGAVMDSCEFNYLKAIGAIHTFERRTLDRLLVVVTLRFHRAAKAKNAVHREGDSVHAVVLHDVQALQIKRRRRLTERA